MIEHTNRIYVYKEIPSFHSKYIRSQPIIVHFSFSKYRLAGIGATFTTGLGIIVIKQQLAVEKWTRVLGWN
jgi:hypothetical protein